MNTDDFLSLIEKILFISTALKWLKTSTISFFAFCLDSGVDRPALAN